MTILTTLQFIVNIIIVFFLFSVLVMGAVLLFKDKRQKQHSVLRNYPLLARIRYFGEKLGLNYVSIYFWLIPKVNHLQEMILQILSLRVNIILE